MNIGIKKFIQHQTCATICCIDDSGGPYCFSCFFAFDPEEGLLCFKSSGDSYHSMLMKKNTLVAGTILPDNLNRFVIKGIQFIGIVLDAQDDLLTQASLKYHQKYPMAFAVPGDMWIMQLQHIKMTDGAAGFWKKILWDINSEVLE